MKPKDLPASKRLFFALDIQHHDKAMIEKWRDKQLALPFKPIMASNFHITLAFLGATTNKQQQALTLLATKLAKELKEELKEVQENTLELNHLGLFKKPKVLYLGLSHCPYWLLTLAQQLSDGAIQQGMIQENRPYCPHLSIYRKATSLTNIPEEVMAVKIQTTINSFSLYESISSEQGVIYQAINTWPLQLKC